MAEPEIPPHNLIVDCRELHADLLDLETTHAWFFQNGASFQGPLEAGLASDPE